MAKLRRVLRRLRIFPDRRTVLEKQDLVDIVLEAMHNGHPGRGFPRSIGVLSIPRWPELR